MKKFKLLLLPMLFLLTGCGVRKKQLLTQVSQGMNKKEVESKIGRPDNARSPIINSRGDVIDIWEYNLATVDQNKLSKTIGLACACFFFWPMILISPFMDSPYDYDMYFLEFINNALSRWGILADLRTSHEEHLCNK